MIMCLYFVNQVIAMRARVTIITATTRPVYQRKVCVCASLIANICSQACEYTNLANQVPIAEGVKIVKLQVQGRNLELILLSHSYNKNKNNKNKNPHLNFLTESYSMPGI